MRRLGCCNLSRRLLRAAAWAALLGLTFGAPAAWAQRAGRGFRPGFGPPPGGRAFPGRPMRPRRRGGWANEGKTFDVRVPSDGAGGGTLAVRVWSPESPKKFRFHEGAPVLVFVLGGQSPGDLARGLRGVTRAGVIQITYNYPGGGSGRLKSDGEYDYRGMNCIKATRDVIRFALGELTDAQGRRLDEIVGGPVCFDNVGVLGSSSGGMMFFSTFAQYPEALKNLAFYVGWENPTTGQTLLFDLGSRQGRGRKLLPNPAFVRYGPTSCKMDFSKLKWDPNARADFRDTRLMNRGGFGMGRRYSGALYLDNNGNGRCDVRPGHNPDNTFDRNGNGKIDPDEDWAFAYIAQYDKQGRLKVYYSQEVIDAAFERRVFGDAGPPKFIATPEECRAYWKIRNSLRAFPLIKKYAPKLKVILVAGAEDHVQACPAHPHIQQAYDGLRAAGVWCRLNPDAAYVKHLIGPRLRGRLVDNDANRPIPVGQMKRFVHPVDAGAPKPIFQLAAVLELADRIHAKNFKPNLSRVLYPNAPMGATVQWTPRTRSETPATRPDAQTPQAAEAKQPTAPRYLLTIVNLNYFRQSVDQRRAAQSMREFLRMARDCGVEPELFFTGLSFSMYRKCAPEILEGLRKSRRDWHHHGANRPPKPSPIDRVMGLPWEKAVKAVQEYEQYEIVQPDIATLRRLRIRRGPRVGATLDHSRVGGLKKMCRYFGRPPLATGRFGRAPILYVCKQYGVKMGVGLQDLYNLDSGWLWYMGVLMRPDDVFIHPTWDFNEWARYEWERKNGRQPDPSQFRAPPGEPLDLKQKIEKRLARLDPNLPGFVTYCFHDNDFFGYSWTSPERYSSSYRAFYMRKCEEILRWLLKEKGLKPISLRQVYEMAAKHNLKPTLEEARTLAKQIAASVEAGRGLPSQVKTPRAAYALTEAWQLFAACLAGREPAFPDFIGPTRMGRATPGMGVVSRASVCAAARRVAVKGAVPSSVEVDGRRMNAAEFLYLMSRAVLGDERIRGRAVSMLQPLAARAGRGHILEELQFWTYKPAYYAAARRVQKATSTSVNRYGQAMRRMERRGSRRPARGMPDGRWRR